MYADVYEAGRWFLSFALSVPWARLLSPVHGHGVSTQRLGGLIPMDGFGETLIGDVFGIEFEFLNGDTLLSDLGIRLNP